MTSAQVTIAEAIAQYVAGLPTAEQLPNQQELQRFARWYGPDRPVGRIVPGEIDSYVGDVESTGASPAQRLQPLRSFLQDARQAGLIGTNLATHVRIRRPGTKRSTVEAQKIEEPVIHLTSEGYKRLKAELEELVALRPKIVEDITHARADKDFRENAPLDAARERQAQVEARIRELQMTLRFAALVDASAGNGVRASLGSTVALRDLEFDDEMTIMLVSPSEVDTKQGKISIASPIGRAVLDRQVGDEVDVEAPAGTLRYRIERIER